MQFANSQYSIQIEIFTFKFKNYSQKLKPIFEQNSNQTDKTEYDICKQELNTIYNETSTRITIRSWCDWYEFN